MHIYLALKPAALLKFAYLLIYSDEHLCDKGVLPLSHLHITLFTHICIHATEELRFDLEAAFDFLCMLRKVFPHIGNREADLASAQRFDDIAHHERRARTIPVTKG